MLLLILSNSDTSSPAPAVSLQPPDLERYLVWDGQMGRDTIEFSKYRGTTIKDLLKTFKGIMVKEKLQEFM